MNRFIFSGEYAFDFNERLKELFKITSMTKDDLDEFAETANTLSDNLVVVDGGDSLKKELKQVRKRLKHCNYLEGKALREREIELRKEIKNWKR